MAPAASAPVPIAADHAEAPNKPLMHEMAPPASPTTPMLAADAAAAPPPAADADAAPSEQGAEPLVLRGVQVRIQKRPAEGVEPEYEAVTLAELRLPQEATLDDIRAALTGCELGDPGRDIFFPAWTKSLYIMWAGEGAVETVEDDTALRAVLAREAGAPGTLTLLLQECRNARYSRRKRAARKGAMPSMLLWPAPAPAPRADRPVFFDRVPYYHYYSAGDVFVPPPPPFIVPFVYAPPQH